MSADTAALGRCWRVGYHREPLGFVPHELASWSHRFDDVRRRVRTIYAAESPTTALREVLGDFRPNLAAIRHFQMAMGADAAADVPSRSITAAWREQHVLAPLRAQLAGPLCDLADVRVRHAVEQRHAALLVEHGLHHLDLHEITTRRRVITQTIAADLYDRGVAAIRFPSRLDGGCCVALFEGRARLTPDGDPVLLTDPPPRELLDVAESWGLRLAPTDWNESDGAWYDANTERMIAEEPW